jgi:chorismate mutase/prephenate dehydratase
MAGSDLSQRLRNRRRKIDLIDQKLLSLLNQRLRVALEIGKVKRKMGKKIYDPKREKESLERLRLKLRLRNKGLLKEKDLEKIFKTIISVCRRVQKVVSSEVPL